MDVLEVLADDAGLELVGLDLLLDLAEAELEEGAGHPLDLVDLDLVDQLPDLGEGPEAQLDLLQLLILGEVLL